MVRQRVVSWFREHPRMADGLLAAVITVISLVFHLTEHGSQYHRPSVWGAVLTLAATAPIAWRRRAPLTVLGVVLVAQMIGEAFNYVGPGWSGVLIAAYTVGSERSEARVWRLAALLIPLVLAFVTWGVVRGDAPWQALISAPLMLGGAMVLGDNMRRRREHVAELAERAERAERERELVTHQRVHEERTRIARELHDVVAHSVSLMVIQTSAARRQLALDPVRADEALATVETTGRTAMTEMRRILGVLRDEEPRPELAPQPSLSVIDDLIAASSDLPVAMHAAGDLAGLPPGVELSAYRIVQESLTNVRRHAGVVQRVEVSVARLDDALVVEVNDDGRGASASATAHDAGFGILGMKERVAAYDGELLVGPRVGGGWRVKAVFPVSAE
jgi:signal transduction histidine kinase